MTFDEERALAQVAREAIKELRQRRRWKIIFRLLWVAVMGVFFWQMFFAGEGLKGGMVVPHVAVVEVHGIISDGAVANAPDMIESLERAFSQETAQAVVLDINSPGGSPVQSGQVYRAIRALKQQYQKPVYAVISDTGASGAYYIAAAADEIYADPASVVGSIGVIAQSVGYEALADKLGLEPRTFTAGEYKDFLNGNRALKPKELEHMQALLQALHRQFIAAVKEGRGERLQDSDEIFSGLFWTGEQSVAMGLTDGLSSMYEFKQAHFKESDFVVYSPDLSAWQQLARDVGVQMRVQLGRWLGLGEQANIIHLK